MNINGTKAQFETKLKNLTTIVQSFWILIIAIMIILN
jgi:type II secretory pathway component PulF